MESLVKLSSKKSLSILPKECIDELIKESRVYCYVILEKEKVSRHSVSRVNGKHKYLYMFSGVIYKNYEDAKEYEYKYSEENTILSCRLDSGYPLVNVYILLNEDNYPIVVTNDPNEWLEKKVILKDYVIPYDGTLDIEHNTIKLL